MRKLADRISPFSASVPTGDRDVESDFGYRRRPTRTRRRAARHDDWERASRRLGFDPRWCHRCRGGRRRRTGRQRGGVGPGLPRDPGAGEHPPPHVPEPDAVVRAGDQQRLAGVARAARADVDPPRRGGGVCVGVDRAGRTRPGWMYDVERPPVRAPPAEVDRRPGRRRSGHRHALSCHPRGDGHAPRGQRISRGGAVSDDRRDPRRL